MSRRLRKVQDLEDVLLVGLLQGGNLRLGGGFHKVGSLHQVGSLRQGGNFRQGGSLCLGGSLREEIQDFYHLCAKNKILIFCFLGTGKFYS
jgi:hypothetical protein